MNFNTTIYPNLLLDRNRERQVVFYGRVSTEHEAQISALENQMQWYDTQAQEHKNWIIVGRYIDEGITGTQAKKRPAFLNMIEDAKKGKFDLIVTREVCRFARNTVDTLVTTRELRNYGIEVYFVEDNIWTMDGDGELRLTIMATLAQEESRKVSERVKAGQQISREKGVVYGRGNILGYDRVGDTYVINEEQAETVRLIYKLYVQDGLGASLIAKELERLGKKTATGMTHWHFETVMAILKNPTYTGFQAYGKSFSNNYLEQKRIQNRDRHSYMYKKCDYEPIISQELFFQAQETRESKSTLCYSTEEAGDGRTIKKAHKVSMYMWARKVMDERNVPYARFRWSIRKNGERTYAYMKRNPITDGHTKFNDGVPEWRLELMGRAVIEYISNNIQEIASAIQIGIESKNKIDNSLSVKTITADKLAKKLETLLEMRVNNEINADEYKKRKETIEAELNTLKAIDSLPPGKVHDYIALGEITNELKNKLADSNTMPEAVDNIISRIVPQSKSLFKWYVKIANGEVAIPVESTGREKKATVIFYEDWKINK